ncbi:MAG: DHA2 family efflux MFS transporter permease subunit [Frankiales bacterium]|nr:DHA2 family efflux MFS transporter permease subunit [Frankiales bacterium]
MPPTPETPDTRTDAPEVVDDHAGWELSEAGVPLDPQRWRALFVIAMAQLMIILDASIVNLALPRAKADLGIADADQQWVVTGYALAFGGLLLLGGRIADFIGRKRAFIIGLIGFATASAIGGAAPTAVALFAARGLQGAFAALLAPAALSLITVTFHVPKERARAFGVYGAISGGGAAIGLLLGGVLTEYLSWRWCLLVNVPIAILAVALAVPFVRESRAGGSGSYDVLGAITVSVGLVSLVYGFTKAAPHSFQESSHWTEPATLVWFGLAAVLLVAFFVIENRVANPLLPMRVLLDRNRGAAYLVSLIVGIGMFAMFLFLGLYLQVVLGYSPVTAGFAFLPFSVGIIIGAGIASQLLPRVGPKPLIVPGLLAAAAGLFWLSRLEYDSSYFAHVLPPMLVMSLGMAFIFIPVSTAALHGIDRADAGIGSAMLNTSQQIGGAVGTGLLNTVAVAATTAYIAANGIGAAGINPALTAGYSRAFLVGSGFLVTAAIVAFVMFTVGRDAVNEDDEVASVPVG